METILELGLQNALMAGALALFVAGLSLFARRPAFRHSLWLLVLLKLLTPPLWDWPIAWGLPREPDFPEAQPVTAPLDLSSPLEVPAPHAPVFSLEEPSRSTERPTALSTSPASGACEPALSTSSEPSATGFTEAAPVASVQSWKLLALGLWGAGSLFWLSLILCRLWRFRKLLLLSRPAGSEVQQSVERLAALLGVRRCPRVWLAPCPVSPLLFALWNRPGLVISEALWLRLSELERETLLAHELVHLRRGDHWVRWLELFALFMYFWHPVVWWARRKLRDAEEECCDAWVVSTFPAARAAYASALVETVSFLSKRRAALPLLASGAGHARFLKRRLTMIMKGKPRARLSWLGAVAVLALGVLLPLRPTLAQSGTTPAARPDRPSTEPAKTPRNAPATSSDTIPAPSLANRSTPESLQDLSDEVDLLRVQLVAKQAEMQEASALLGQARRVSERITKQGAARVVSEGEVEQARTEVEVREARLLVKEAHVKEAALRLSQAERRLGTQRQRGGPWPAPKGPTSPAEVPMLPSQPNRSSVTNASPAPPKADPLNVPATHSRQDTLPSTGGSAVTDRERLNELEKKIERLSKELDALRRQIGSQPNPNKQHQ